MAQNSNSIYFKKKKANNFQNKIFSNRNFESKFLKKRWKVIYQLNRWKDQN